MSDIKVSNKFDIVIEQYIKGVTDNDEGYTLSIDYIKESLNKTAWLYAIILHDKDIDDNGEYKRPHYHLYIKSLNKMSIGGILKRLSIQLNIPINAISCDFSIDERKSILYLTHRDRVYKEQDNKYLYNVEDIETNCDDLIIRNYHYKGVLTPKDIINVIYLNECSTCKIVSDIGTETYIKYRWLIQDIIKELKENKEDND